MSEYYIAPEWLEAVCNATFFYPAAGSDYSDALAIFQDYVSAFWFCDIHYPAGLELRIALRPTHDVRRIERRKEGALNAIEESRTDANGRRYKFLLPSKLVETYERGNGSRFTVVRRRGFGQIALSTEFAERSVGVFMHRGDSPGDGGSNVYFLSNKKTYYEPCGRLFDKLARRLTDKALIITDGSNTSIKQLRRFHNHLDIEGRQAFEYHQRASTKFIRGYFKWRCVGWLTNGYGPTLVWGLIRRDTATGNFDAV